MGIGSASRRGESRREGLRPRALAAGSLLLVSSLGGVGCASCRKGRDTGAPLDKAALGACEKVSGTDFAPYLAAVRAIVSHKPVPDAKPPVGPGDRVFLTAWAPGKQPVRTTGLGATLLDSVSAASEEMAKTVASSDGVRFEIDVLTSAVGSTLDPMMRQRIFDVGLSGWMASDGASRVGWILPSEILFDHDVDLESEKHEELHLKGEKLVDAIAARAHTDALSVRQMHVARFDIDAHIEPAVAGEAPIALYRSMPPHPTTLTPDALVASVRAGADYLARVIDDKGVFAYIYNPVLDRKELRGYSLLRHAGSVYALMEAYEELRVIAWQQKAALAIAYLKTTMKPTADGSVIIENVDEEQQKVGANGLSLVALVEYARATGDMSDLPTMRELARYIVHQQYGDGHFRENADVMREDESARNKKLKKEIYYYTGEATLGLVRLYGIDPDETWLTAARKSADFVVKVRDARDDLKTQIHDHWLSYALHDLYVITKEPSYAAHATKIAQAIFLGERTTQSVPPAQHPDYVGSFYDPATTTPTSTRLEALASTYQLARFMGTDETKLRDVAMELACYMRSQQLDADSAYFAKDPAKAIGGVREGLLNADIRIDYPQHAMSAWLRLARLLRDPQWGKPSK